MTEYQTHAALVATLETEIVRLRAVNAGLMQAARQALEALERPRDQNSWYARACSDADAAKNLREALEAQEPWTPDDMAYRPGGLSQHVTDDHQVFKLGYAKGVDDAERRAKARGEQPAAVVKKPVSAIHLGWDRLDNGQLVATYFLPVAEMAAPKLYTTPQPARQPLSDDWIRGMCKESWVFDAAKQWIRIAERAHGIGGAA